MCNCHSLPECCVMFSGVKLSIRSFNLLLLLLSLLLFISLSPASSTYNLSFGLFCGVLRFLLAINSGTIEILCRSLLQSGQSLNQR